VERYVAFLRGMNLGKRRLKNDELKSHFEELGFGQVATFRASGNVIFSAAAEAETTITDRIEEELHSALGYGVSVVLRTGAELVEIAGRVPFEPELVDSSGGKLQVELLRKKPAAAKRRGVLELASDQDRLAISGRELYWLPSGGILDSSLDRKAIDAMLGLGTMRTKGTIDQIVAKQLADRAESWRG
jgi:uncharacterized protein (DUF1697 family)